MMLKARDALYGVGRTKDMGVWWKWKVDPFSVDAVLIYAQRGHGRRASLYSDYTFAVWDGPPDASERALVPFAKAYSGLTDEEMRQVDSIVRKTTVEKFGPVSSVTPSLVFELGFEGIALSKRHKSGIAVRFPRMLRWRQDKSVEEADNLGNVAGFAGLTDPCGSELARDTVYQLLYALTLRYREQARSHRFVPSEPIGAAIFRRPFSCTNPSLPFLESPFKTLVRDSGSEIATFIRSYAFQ